MDYRTHANLRDLLADLYFRDPDILHVVVTVGLKPAFIAWDERPVNTWHDVLTQADNYNKIKDLLTLVKTEKPSAKGQIELAEKDLLLGVQVPELAEAAWQGPTGGEQLEALIGKFNTLRDVGFLMRGWKVSKAVARVVLADGSNGTAFLTPNDVIITNHHVLPDAASARTARVEFNYQQSPEGKNEPVDAYELDPDMPNGFATSPIESQGGDDWTAVKVKGHPAAKWDGLLLQKLPDGSPQKDSEVIIIQHPLGGPKQIALSHNVVAYADSRRLQYLTDTLQGSSGSPVFDMDWRVVALHHKGGQLVDPATKQKLARNQGIHINVVIEGLKAKGLS